MQLAEALDYSRPRIHEFIRLSGQVIVGKSQQLKLSLACLLAEGHLLIEDVPGVGKTTLVRFLSKALGLQESRIQFTNDLLPSDILGTSIFDKASQKFTFHPGPIFSQLVLGDELNRATPKTQSACLQAMEEARVTVDGVTHELPRPFFVIATQNPEEQLGTYPLPESQLDRFLMRIELGFPDRENERLLLTGERRDVMISEMKSVMSPEDLLSLQKQVRQVHTSDALIQYVQDILTNSRDHSERYRGLSPRAGLALLSASRAWAFIEGRDMVLPEDVQAVAPSTLGHRLNHFGDSSYRAGVARVTELLRSVRVD